MVRGVVVAGEDGEARGREEERVSFGSPVIRLPNARSPLLKVEHRDHAAFQPAGWVRSTLRWNP